MIGVFLCIHNSLRNSLFEKLFREVFRMSGPEGNLQIAVTRNNLAQGDTCVAGHTYCSPPTSPKPGSTSAQ
jgi:hypothetical protein